MVDWSSTAEIIRDANIFSYIIHIMFGIYTWEILTTMDFDIKVVTGKKRLIWPLIFYFFCRYSMFIAVLGVIIALDITSAINCQALYTVNQFFGEVGIATASTLLMLRAIAVWRRSLWITLPLVLLSAAQWGVLMHAVTTVHAVWSDASNACLITSAGTVSLDIIYLYTMSFDFIVLVLTIAGVTRNMRERTTVRQIVFQDGIIYFLIAFFSNAFPAVFVLLNLNPSMNIMFSVPAAIASATVACRSFVRLSAAEERFLIFGPIREELPTNVEVPKISRDGRTLVTNTGTLVGDQGSYRSDEKVAVGDA